MKEWIKKYGLVHLMFLLLVLVFVLEEYRIQNLEYEEDCPLCAVTASHQAPIIMDLATGKALELRVKGENGDENEQQAGYIAMTLNAGLISYYDPVQHTNSVTIPYDPLRYDRKVFCRGCRSMIESAGQIGYNLIDATDTSIIRICPIEDAAEYSVGDSLTVISQTEQGRFLVSVSLKES